ncbi:MAG: C25 family cysteine peptidase [Acidobacteriota bacterium]|nr:C25 family cysteine peptidase [Acidobacteriota bacterium]
MALPSAALPSADLEELGLPAARAELAAALATGPLLVNYVGHGGVDRMAHEGLLTAADVATLPATETAAIVSAWTCVLARIDLPAFDSLGELLVLTPQGGAAAVVAPTGLSVAGQAHVLNRLYFEALGRHERVGDALLEAVQHFREQGGLEALPRTYAILGDPAVLVY